MKFTEKIKRFFGLDEVENAAGRVGAIPESNQKWKALALELNKELQHTRKQHKFALQECLRLQAICDCQGELLADRETVN